MYLGGTNKGPPRLPASAFESDYRSKRIKTQLDFAEVIIHPFSGGIEIAKLVGRTNSIIGLLDCWLDTRQRSRSDSAGGI